MSKSAFVLDLTTLGNGISRVTLGGGARDLELPESEWPGGIEGTAAGRVDGPDPGFVPGREVG